MQITSRSLYCSVQGFRGPRSVPARPWPSGPGRAGEQPLRDLGRPGRPGRAARRRRRAGPVNNHYGMTEAWRLLLCTQYPRLLYNMTQGHGPDTAGGPRCFRRGRGPRAALWRPGDPAGPGPALPCRHGGTRPGRRAESNTPSPADLRQLGTHRGTSRQPPGKLSVMVTRTSIG